VPTERHHEVAAACLQAGLHVLVEKPIAVDLAQSDALIALARQKNRVLQVGHVERYNAAFRALAARMQRPLLIDAERLSGFKRRGADVDVVLDLMIHDIDIVLALVGAEPEEIRAAGISVLSGTVDIANVRLQFGSGCVANLTASRVSTEKVRKLRLFQPKQYLSLEYTRQDLFILSVNEERQVTPEPVFVTKSEPLQNQLDAFIESVNSRKIPKTSGTRARQTLGVALSILDKIKEHSELVSKSLVAGWNR
jgi:predicted dehydrogenase